MRITHLKTGITVQCQNQRSQHKNKASALKVLKARLYQLELDKEKVIEFYHNKGHRDFSILSDSIIYDGKSKYLDIILNVDEGPKYKYRDFT